MRDWIEGICSMEGETELDVSAGFEVATGLWELGGREMGSLVGVWGIRVE
jgi:hypothetical protein